MYAWGWVIVIILGMDLYQSRLDHFLPLALIWGVTFVLAEFSPGLGLPFSAAAALPAAAGSLMYDVVFSYPMDWVRAAIIFCIACLYYFFFFTPSRRRRRRMQT